jgi:hypothetical protein
MNRRKRKALKRAQVIENQKYSDSKTITYSSFSTIDQDPAAFIRRLKGIIQTVYSVDGNIHANYQPNHSAGKIGYFFKFDVQKPLSDEQRENKLQLLIAEDRTLYQNIIAEKNLAGSAKTKVVTQTVNPIAVAVDIMTCGKIMKEIQGKCWVVVVARPKPNNSIKKNQIETGIYDCLQSNQIKEIGFNRTATQVVIAAFVENVNGLDDLRMKLEGRFTNANFFIETGIDRGERASELSDKVAASLKCLRNNDFDNKFESAMAKIWFNPFIVRRDEDKQFLDKRCA